MGYNKGRQAEYRCRRHRVHSSSENEFYHDHRRERGPIHSQGLCFIKTALHLILTDFQMPEMNGFDLAREIKTIESLKGVPIIVLSSAGRKGDGKICTDIGIEGYLTKPIRRDDLRKAIEPVLGLSVIEEDQASPKLVTRHTIAEDR